VEETVVERGAQGGNGGGGGGVEGREPRRRRGGEGERAAEEGARHVLVVSASAAAVGDYRRRAGLVCVSPQGVLGFTFMLWAVVSKTSVRCMGQVR
jgi:hypothetical protein